MNVATFNSINNLKTLKAKLVRQILQWNYI